ncbi:CBS domain-containing protein [Pelagibaculum spongiae]|uniref:CBS domain-containing protein n=1 Tax=Pelagibaculum spongiae TaxID=2080658 RepID=A0A2V1GPZ2_9GAMM|nr:CBS domain-containing protein [Pelagibaculum spongiae]PVZ65473.1 hypothetical protein DC094_18515 [Pelagibaculum spongiae]
MKSAKTVKDLMVKTPLFLGKNQTLASAVKTMLEQQVPQGIVVDQQKNLLGVISVEHLLGVLWLHDFEDKITASVADVMQQQVATVNESDSLHLVAEKMTAASKTVFPVSSSGILLDYDAVSLSARISKSAQGLPNSFPVVAQNKVVGVIERQQILSAYQGCFGE